jgi:hypothetical protein
MYPCCLATGSHAPAWELILGCNTIDKVCVPTRERGNAYGLLMPGNKILQCTKNSLVHVYPVFIMGSYP